MKNKRVRQGQSRWIAVAYQDGQDDSEGFVAVYQCFVTKVKGTAVYYNAGSMPYICGGKRFIQITTPSFRKAVSAAKVLLNEFSTKEKP